ncbi:MAG: glycosyltransferase [Candidatus Magasanikbacteria bacterium]
MKIHILYELKDGPWGGANQFLKALKEQFVLSGVYEENIGKADIILFNSHHECLSVIKTKYKYPKKIFIHRVDGPLYKVRGNDLKSDYFIYRLNNSIADGTIFQSKWSEKMNYFQGMTKNHCQTTILNAPGSEFKKIDHESAQQKGNKTKLIAVSWSPNIKKGFLIYNYLDKHLDFDKYEMTFIGNSPVRFKNIKMIKPMLNRDLSHVLNLHDIFVTASEDDPCSNSLTEALACGLPAVALDSGGHPELLGLGGELFKGMNDILGKIERVCQKYKEYQHMIHIENIEQVTQKYIIFASLIMEDVASQKYLVKNISIYHYTRLVFSFYVVRVIHFFSMLLLKKK